jgi:hypothetical protein
MKIYSCNPPTTRNVFFCCCCCCCIRVGEWTRAVVFISSKRLQHRSFPRSSKWSSSFFSLQLLLCGCLFPIHKFSYSDVSYTTSARVMGGDLSYRELLSLNKDTKIHHRRTLGRLGSDSISEKPIRLESRKTLYYNFFSFTGDVKRVIIFSAGKTTDRQEGNRRSSFCNNVILTSYSADLSRYLISRKRRRRQIRSSLICV